MKPLLDELRDIAKKKNKSVAQVRVLCFIEFLLHVLKFVGSITCDIIDTSIVCWYDYLMVHNNSGCFELEFTKRVSGSSRYSIRETGAILKELLSMYILFSFLLSLGTREFRCSRLVVDSGRSVMYR